MYTFIIYRNANEFIVKKKGRTTWMVIASVLSLGACIII